MLNQTKSINNEDGDVREAIIDPGSGSYSTLPLISLSQPSKIRPVDYLVCVLVVVFMVASAQVSQTVQLTYNLNNPAFIIWFSTSWLILCFPLQIIYFAYIVKEKGSIVEMLGGIRILRKNIRLAPLFALYWYLANYLFVWGLSETNVASSLCIEQIATVFVFILSVLFLKETASIGKTLSVLICIGGVVMVAVSDKRNYSDGRAPLMGDILIIGSACATAAYMVTYKKVMQNTYISSMNALLGFIGLCNLLLFWPLFVILHYARIEPLHAITPVAWGIFFASCTLSFLFNYLLNLGIFFTSPLFFRVGQICSIPASFVLEVVFLKGSYAVLRMVGAGVVVVGFCLFSYFSHLRSITKSPRVSTL